MHGIDLATALQEIFGVDDGIEVIGTRHGEKLFESLVSREEMARAQDEGSYFRIPVDNRDLNYSKFFSEGDSDLSDIEDYTSHNTARLAIQEIKTLLLSLDFVKEAINA